MATITVSEVGNTTHGTVYLVEIDGPDGTPEVSTMVYNAAEVRAIIPQLGYRQTRPWDIEGRGVQTAGVERVA